MKLALVLSPVVLLILTGAAYGQSTINTVPSYKRAQTVQEPSHTEKAMLSELTKRFQEKLGNPNSKYKLSPEQIQALAVLSQDAAYSQALRGIVDSTTTNPTIVAVNQVRLESLAELSNAADKNEAGVKDLGTLMTKVKPETLNPDSLKNLATFMETVKTGLEQNVPAHELLMYSKNILSQGQGLDFDVEFVQQAAATPMGVNEIFLARNEVRVVKIGEYNAENGTAVPIEIAMKPAEAEALAANATKIADAMIDKALSPQGRESLVQQQAQEIDKELEKSTEEVGMFLKGNKILDRRSDQYKRITEEQAQAVENINDLLNLLKEMGHDVGTHSWKGWMAEKARNAPVLGKAARKIIPDPIEMLKTHRQRIEEVDKTLLDNAKLLHENTTEIKRVQEILATKVHDLKVKMAMNRIIADRIRLTVNDLRAAGRNEEADKLTSILGSRVEKALNYALGQIAATNLANEVMNQQFEACKNLREDINTVRNTAIPLFTATEMAKNINQTLQMAADTNNAVRVAMEKQLQELKNQLKSNNDLMIMVNGKPVLDPAKLNEMANFLLAERDRIQKANVENYQKMQKHNAAMTAAFNKIEASMGSQLATRCDVMSSLEP